MAADRSDRGAGPLPRRAPDELEAAVTAPVDAATLAAAAEIVAAVRDGGEAALRSYAERLDGLEPGAPLVIGRDRLAAALAALPAADRQLLERAAGRIRRFAEAQRACLTDLEIEVPGGRAGHRVSPVARAGCYAPGGRYPLPSSVLMTAVTARAAGVAEVWVASPRPAPVTLAAAAVAGADALVAAGGAQAVAAFAYGAGPVPRCDVVVGPGNRWVTAAKQLVFGQVAIDMLAGPSELVVIADGAADPALIAADLLAQAEHDTDARPFLLSPDPALIEAVEEELERQLADLPAAEVARAALANGAAVATRDLEQAAALSDRLAPEHLQLMVAEPHRLAERLTRYGALFLGAAAGEVLGDYAAGPNHVLPTGGSARSTGGLSVLSFLAVRSWLEIEDPNELADDATRLAELEGLEGHARAARRRR